MTHAVTRNLIVISLACLAAACGEKGQAPGGATSATPAAAQGPIAVVFTGHGSTDAPAGGHCSLDAINGAPVQGASLPVGADAMFGGWMVDGQGNVPGQARLVLRGTHAYSVPLVAGGDRPDVAQALNSQAARMSGFNIATSLAGVEAGEYALSIELAGETPATCDLKSTLAVTSG
jgi:hypothetical protein